MFPFYDGDMCENSILNKVLFFMIVNHTNLQIMEANTIIQSSFLFCFSKDS